MFDGMHHQDQLFHNFISSSSSASSPSSSSSSSRPPSSTLHHLQQQIAASGPFPNFDSPYPTTSTPSSSTQQHHHHHHQQSIQFHDLFQRPNLQSNFPTPALPEAHHFIPKYNNDQQHSNNNINNHDLRTGASENIIHHKDEGLIIRSLQLPPPAATNTDLDAIERSASSSLPQVQSLNAADFWSDDEVVALLRIRSSLDTSWFPPEFTWEHVSRKLAEIGIKRSAEKCKEKFEEESRTYFNTNFNINNTFNDKISNNTSYKVFGELEEMCHHNANAENIAEADQQNPVNNEAEDMDVEDTVGCDKSQTQCELPAATEIEDSPATQPEPEPEPTAAVVHSTESLLKTSQAKKRMKKQSNKQQKFEMMKEYCEGFVNRMMTQQEEIHNKILVDLLKKDDAIAAREDAWKRTELERANKELEVRAQEQAIAGDKQAAIIELLNKFSTTASASTSTTSHNECIIDQNIVAQLLKVLPKPTSVLKVSRALVPNDQNMLVVTTQSPCPNLPTLLHETLEPQTPTSAIEPTITSNVASASNSALIAPTKTNARAEKQAILLQVHDPNSMATNTDNKLPAMSDDYGKRWPRDEVLALINLRCSFLTNNNSNNNGDGERDAHGSKAPLWERISLKMAELGYKRSAKRCKEKWENINKYFRKTKDNTNKKRSLESRTCPYFHQLSHLYKQGTLVAPADGGHESCLPVVSRSEGANENTADGASGESRQ